MLTRPASALSCACAAVLFVVVCAPAHALLIDHFDHATDPAIDATRTLDALPLNYPTPPGGSGLNLTLMDDISVIVYDGDSVPADPSGLIIFEMTTTLDITGGGVNTGLTLNFLGIEHTSGGLGSLDVGIVLEDSTTAFVAALQTLPQSATPTKAYFDFGDFLGGPVDLTDIKFIVVSLSGPGDGSGNLAAALDSIEAVPTPSALAMGLIGVLALGARRRRIG